MSFSNQCKTRLAGEYNFKTDKERIDFLANLIEKGSQDPVIYETTRKILKSKGVKSYDRYGEIKTIGEFVRDNIDYRNHILCRDSFQDAKRTLELGAGDCDQVTVLTNSMLACVGIPIGMRIITTDPDKNYHHIYALAGLRNSDALSGERSTRWIPIDATSKKAPIGWESDYAKKKDFLVICNE